MKIKFRTKYDSRRVSKKFSTPSLTDQQYKDETSIDGIIRRYGVLPRQETFPIADVSEFGSFAEMFQKVEDGKSDFLALPAEIRARFGNDPVAFYGFVTDPTNHDELINMGLAIPAKKKADVVDLLEKIADGVTSEKGSKPPADPVSQ